MVIENRLQRTLFICIALSAICFLFLMGCSGTPQEESINEEVADVATEAPRPTRTAEPTPTAIQQEQPSGQSSVLSGLISGNEEETEEEITPTQEPTVTPIPQFEPVEVSINLQQGDLSPWIELVPPPGWSISQGVDGYLVSRNPSQVPDNPFVLIRRWGNVVNVGDWVAYLPDGQEEPNSTVRIGLAGIEWEGVFITNADNSYRAFFAVNNDTLPSYTLLMYVPAPEGISLTREEMTAVWDRDASDLNTILRRLILS